ncbi:putative transcriptional regulatory protein [Colletotrichum siamense]|uniref:putative transcriptional regulatory protein n=1 Tax=Colletotrichum siamense TaxID=690259 RepID=UPI00187313DE|nr:putative transcriptional regulatory protein [Colletotrichum siamense]KAF5496809.1 putative transcriptional regulatory protein [Colletotrichum siamense]
MLLGSSSGSDPWLLRHFRFDELGLRSFHKLHVRNAGGVPTADKIPVHFLLSSDALYRSSIAEAKAMELRRRLEYLVPQSTGARLVRLFHRYVFEMLPIVSRTAMRLTSQDALPQPVILTETPTHLLAALYGSAIPFAHQDDHLVALSACDPINLDDVWEICYASLQEEFCKPHLHVLQAAILYLHRTHESPRQSAFTDTSSIWPFMGTVAGLAHNLGLHLECRMMGLPAQEKRLRRRLWWAVFIQDKFLSLHTGRPPYIRKDEWDVGELDDFDFLPWNQTNASKASPFRDMARLSLIAETLQADLYSLKSCQKLAENLPDSIQAARPIFDALHQWRASVPIPESFHESRVLINENQNSYPACISLSYLSLVAYTWRALLRPTVRSAPPPQIIDVDAEPQTFPDTGFLFEDLSWNFSDFPELELQLEDGAPDSSATIKELYQAAQTWAETLVKFTVCLTSSEFGQFWYSWSRFGLVVASNFLLLLLVQAPNAESSVRVRELLEIWRQLVKDHAKVSPLFLLTAKEMGQVYQTGIADMFCIPSHVQAIL